MWIQLYHRTVSIANKKLSFTTSIWNIALPMIGNCKPCV